MNRHFLSRPGQHEHQLQLMVIIVCTLALIVAASARAAWEENSYTVILDPVGNPAAVASADDGAGGLLVATLDDDGPGWLHVSRVDHTGNKLWGPDGVVIPFQTSSLGKQVPVAVASDADGGAYVAYRELWPAGQQLLTLAHVTAAGTVEWATPVEDFVADSSALQLFALPTGGGDVILVWTANHAYPDEKLMAAKYRNDGSRIWRTQVADQVHLILTHLWEAAVDGADGLLVAFQRQVAANPTELRVQRIDSAGTALWGSNGVQLWSNLGEIGGVVSDGAGGAIVLHDRNFGEVWAQRVDSSGNESWTPGGNLALDVNHGWTVDTMGYCSDGAGGVIVANAAEDIHVQRIDHNGNRLWAGAMISGVQATALPGWQTDPTLCPDGTGGAHIVYRDHYWSDTTDQHNQSLSGTRLDGFGNAAYAEVVLWQSGWQDGLEPMYPRAVADGTGGALVSWRELNFGSSVGDVRALGAGPDGASPALPQLTIMDPDAGIPGELVASRIYGQYLDTEYAYRLENPDGPVVDITPLATPNSNELEVEIDLTGVPEGPYDLVVSRLGTFEDTLEAAFGVGELPPCEEERQLAVPLSAFSGPTRQTAFDSEGRAHSLFRADDDGVSQVYEHIVGPDFEDFRPIYEMPVGQTLMHLAVAMGPDDRLHLLMVIDDGASILRYLTLTPEGEMEQMVDWPAPDETWRLSLAVSGTNRVKAVAELYQGGAFSLYEINIDGSNFDGPHDLGAGSETLFPDLMPHGADGFVLTWVRDLWLPGFREVCVRFADGGGWGPIQTPYFGVSIISPTIAWDGVDTTLLAFVLDNTGGSAPLLHTCRFVGQTADPVRWRLGEPELFSCQVAAGGERSFWLLTEESSGGPQVQLNLRSGDGQVFYPRLLLNSHTDVGWPMLTASGGAVFARWDDFQDPDIVQGFHFCALGDVSGIPDTMPGMSALAAYPNPFNPQTRLSFELPRAGEVTLNIYDVAGRKVATLLQGHQPAGPGSVTWDGRDRSGRSLGSGLYLARLELAGSGVVQVTKMSLLK